VGGWVEREIKLKLGCYRSERSSVCAEIDKMDAERGKG